MVKSVEIPDCYYPNEATLVRPRSNPPRHSLYLSNLDDQKFLRFSIKYLYLYRRSVSVEALKISLSRALEEYYPLAGRLRACGGEEEKLEVDCNGEGAVFAEGFVDLMAEEFLEGSSRPNRSWRKLLYRVEAQSFLGVPPLVVQVTNLACGGMILCTSINHCVCDGIGSAQFLHAWAHLAAKPAAVAAAVLLPFHGRHMLRPRSPPAITFSHPEFTPSSVPHNLPPTAAAGGGYLAGILQSQPLVPISITFTPTQILQLKKQCVPSLKCTSFEVLASHVWRAWIRSLRPPPALPVKLLFSVNVRNRLKPQLPRGFYGNGFVLGCAETTVDRLVFANPRSGVRLVQEAKECVDGDYVRSMIDLLEVRRVKPDLSATLVISQWSKLGLEDVNFGEGRPLHMGPLASEIYCLFLPVVGDLHAFTVLMSVPESVVNKFEYFMRDLSDKEGKDDDGVGVVMVKDHHEGERGFV